MAVRLGRCSAPVPAWQACGSAPLHAATAVWLPLLTLWCGRANCRPAVQVNINPAFQAAELAYALGQAGVSVLVLAPGLKGGHGFLRVAGSPEVAAQATQLRHRVLLADGAPPEGEGSVAWMGRQQREAAGRPWLLRADIPRLGCRDGPGGCCRLVESCGHGAGLTELQRPGSGRSRRPRPRLPCRVLELGAAAGDGGCARSGRGAARAGGAAAA